jgi:hypothetical protein
MNDDPAFCEKPFFKHLRHHVPLGSVRTDNGGRDELRADVRLRELLFVDHGAPARLFEARVPAWRASSSGVGISGLFSNGADEKCKGVSKV